MKLTTVQPRFKSAREIIAQTRRVFSSERLNTTERAACDFIDTHIPELHRLEERTSYAGWDLYTLGGERVSKRKTNEGQQDFKRRIAELQTKYGERADRADKAKLDFTNNPRIARVIVELYRDRDKIKDPFLKRQVELAYPEFFEYEFDPALQEELSKRETALDLMYGDFKARYRGRKYTDTDLDQAIKDSKSAEEAIELVKAKLSIGNHRRRGKGPTIAEAILEAVKLRNKFARIAGSPNFYSHELKKQEIVEDELVALMACVKDEIKPIFDRLREKMDRTAMQRYGISKAQARFPYFQGGVRFPHIVDDVMRFSPDKYFKGMDPRPLIRETGRKIGIDVDDIVDRSDLFPRDGKNPHWYLFGLRVPDDIRSIGNIDPTFQSSMGGTVSTEFHEVTGHGAGYASVNPELPHLFRDLHTIITESDAMMMEDLMYNKYWLKETAKFDNSTVGDFVTSGRQYNLAQNLVSFFHNYLLITDFERELYNLPDEELTLDNANKLWAKKSYEYLGIRIPKDRNEPDWAYKIHFATAPVYYECYFLGQLVRAQVTREINKLAGKRGLCSKETGDFLKKFRGVGESYPWHVLVKHMTGSSLGVDALRREFEGLEV